MTNLPQFMAWDGQAYATKTKAEMQTLLSIGAVGDIALLNYTTTTPSAPASGDTLYAQQRAGRTMPTFIDPNGLTARLQPIFGGRKISILEPSGCGSTTITAIGITTPTITSFPSNLATNVTYSVSSLLGSFKRLAYISNALANSSCGISCLKNLARGSAAGCGGFYITARFAIDTIAANQRFLCGLIPGTDIGDAADPSAQTNFCAFAADAGDSNLQWMVNDGSGTATKVDLGSNFPAKTSGAMYQATIYCKPNDAVIYYALQRLDVAQLTEGSSSSDLPTSTTAMGFQIHGGTAAVASAVTVSVSSVYMETEI